MSPSPSATVAQTPPDLGTGGGLACRAASRVGSMARRDGALWTCLAVVVLSLLSAYVMVLRDAVRNGEIRRVAFAQQVPIAKTSAVKRQALQQDRADGRM